MRVSRYAGAAIAASAFVVFHVSSAQAAVTPLTAQEFKCSATLAKSFAKLQASVLKIKSKCHNADISGKADSADNCATLDAKAEAKVTKAKEKLQKKVSKDCASVCSPSNDIRCATDMACPAAHVASPANNNIAEGCDGAGGQNPFDLTSLRFPGPYCQYVLGHPMRSLTDLGDCVNTLVATTVNAVDEQTYASLDESPPVDPDAAKCLSSISKAVNKALGSAYLATASCRDTRLSQGIASAPAFACTTQDATVMAAIDDAIGTMGEAIDKGCDNTLIAQLSLCSAQGISPTNVADAKVCLERMVREVATEEHGYNRHVYSPISMINITHPDSAKGYCGDGVVDPTREEHTGIGEECDGSDAPCGAGSCIPPGDVFECTCDNVPRERFIVNGDEDKTDSDAGWMGSSHDATHNNGFGYVNELSNCTCNAFSGATCTSSSGDDVCDIAGNMAPRCSDDLNGTQTCDERGNNNGSPENSDCNRCDDYSLNAGTYCAHPSTGNANETVCQSQCIVDATGLPAMPATPCTNQSGCADGQTCRGRCDASIVCNKMTEGSPLPLISASNPVCVMLEYKTDITGTKNMVTGETEVHYTTRSLIALGSVFAQPCPVCAGTCVGGSANAASCYGRCAIGDQPCLFDSDCPTMGDVCAESSVECPGGGYCSLDLRCSEGPNAGKLCRPDSTTVLGEVSHDCPPVPNAQISGTGVTQPFGTITTKEVEFQAGAACTDPAYGNFDCPCPADTPPNSGVPTKPNACSGACDAGVNAGQPCAVGTGQYTTCVGGGDAGFACDADSDCDSNDCSGTANHCTAGTTSLLGNACNVNTDCGGGGLCEPPCPGGRCVPLCMQEGKCNGGGRDGDPCSTLEHCKQCTAGSATLLGTACDVHSRCDSSVGSGDGFCAPAPGVTCDITDPEDGMCAAGPNKYRCTGEGFTTIPCTLEYGKCNAGHCEIASPDKVGDACAVNADCLDTPNVPVSAGCETGVDAIPGNADDIPGSGVCEPRPEDCYYDNGRATGGDTVIGGGDATNVNINACFCTPANANSAVNNASGFGGPSRIRRQGVAFVNVPSIP